MRGVVRKASSRKKNKAVCATHDDGHDFDFTPELFFLPWRLFLEKLFYYTIPLLVNTRVATLVLSICFKFQFPMDRRCRRRHRRSSVLAVAPDAGISTSANLLPMNFYHSSSLIRFHLRHACPPFRSWTLCLSLVSQKNLCIDFLNDADRESPIQRMPTDILLFFT